LVGGDVVDGVGRRCAGFDSDSQYQRAVEEGLVSEVGISRLAGAGVAHGRTEVSVGVADVDYGGVVAVDGDGRRGVCRRGGRILRDGFWKGRGGRGAWLGFGAWCVAAC
jgi:hypothetical protein